MSRNITFKNPPITEALFDIRVQLPKEIDVECLEKFHEGIKDRFPDKVKKMFIQTGIELKPGESPISLPTSSGPRGYIFNSTKEKKAVQARLDGFTFNKLKPYHSWEEFSHEAYELWNHYISIAKPVKITRLALRYINRIEIPLPIKDFKDYILTGPEIAPTLPQELDNFFMQLIIPQKDTQARATINQTMEAVTPEGKLPYIFDIDVWRLVDLSVSSEKITGIFETLRDFKNDVFHESTTEQAKELFQ